MRKATLLALALSLMAGLLVGCGSSTVKLGWSGSSDSSHKSIRYASYDGVEWKTFRAEAGQSISLDYDVTVEKGALVLNVVDPNGKVLWEEIFREDNADTVTLTAPQNGFHTIRIEGQATGGGFDIAWSIGK